MNVHSAQKLPKSRRVAISAGAMGFITVFAAVTIVGATARGAPPGTGSTTFTFDPLTGQGLPPALLPAYAPAKTPGFMYSCFQSFGDKTGTNCGHNVQVAITCAARFCRTIVGGGYVGGFVSECTPPVCTPKGTLTVQCF